MISERQTFKREGVRWTVERSFVGSLESVLKSAGEAVKKSPVKLVTRHVTADGTYYVKRYCHSGVALRPLKFFFKPSQAAIEWRLASQLESKGIPIVQHLALGEKWSPMGLQESVLITKAFDGVPLDESPSLDGELVIDFVKRLADARVLHTDFHPGNLLLNSPRGEIRLVDLHGILIRDSASPTRLRDDMLAQLCKTIPLPVEPRIREDATERRKAALAARSRRCLKVNRDFVVERFGGLRWHIRSENLPQIQHILENPDNFLANATPLKQGRSSTVGVADGAVLKRFNFSRWLRPLKDIFRQSRAKQNLQRAYHLELCGIPTARPMAATDQRIAGIPIRGFFLMAEITGASDLTHWTGDERQAARKVGTLIGRMHEEGFTHRDLKESNLLFDESGQPHLIDLEGLRFENAVSLADAAANIRRLTQSAVTAGKLNRSVAVAFLLSYCRCRKLLPRQLFP